MALVKLIKIHASLQPTPSILLEHRNVKEYLLIEAVSAIELNAADGNFMKQSFSKICDAYGCLGAIHLNRGSESLGCFLALITGCKSIGRLLENDFYRITDVSFVSLRSGSLESSSAASEMKRLLCNGSFYFLSSNTDSSKNSIFITNSLQSSAEEERQEYLWNRNLIAYFSMQGIRCRSWLTYIMCGGVDIRTFYGSSQQGRVAVISRLNCERVGTRYNVRGVDYLGNVANFVESEQIICIGSDYSSFIMTRGSVPLYWEQPGLNVGSHKVKTPYSSEVSFQAFERHMEKLISCYNDSVLVNLLGSKEGESYLSKYYQEQHKSSRFGNPDSDSIVEMINFDYHAECRAGKATNIAKLMNQLSSKLEKFGVAYKLLQNENFQSGNQTGVLRVNCLDCLDRTNSVQTYIGVQMAAKQLAVLGHSDKQQILSRVTEPLKAIWQYTGDLISRMYAGTGALEGKDAVGKLKDGAKSISRSIQNNFLDQGKQGTMDTLLRIPSFNADAYHLSRTVLSPQQFRQSSPLLLHSILNQRQSFSQDVPMRVCVGTWNVNGGKKFRSIAYKGKTIKDWLILDDQLLQDGDASPTSYYQAVYEYTSAEEGDLCLALNDFVTVDYELEDGEWLHGSVEGQEGIFPAAYVKRISNPHLVLHDFPSQQDGDLALWTNEIVDVAEENGDWLTGTVFRDGNPEEGTFPANFVEKIGAKSSTGVDIYAIGFEEMVELNAGNIVNASVTNQQAWALELQKTLATNQEYVLITSEQLVGVCLFLFVKKSLAKDVGEVSIATLKTGMGGAAGNKGAVAISMSLYSTTFCFVCSHFAAGQSQVIERNSDFEEIYSKLYFAKGRPLACHDYIFWCGDFNYRIDMPGDDVKELIKAESWEKLKAYDQLLEQKKMKNVFKGFLEGDINFAPTYKYDLFSDDYDTSEKCRVPAWTDRVLWKRKRWLSQEEQDENVSNIDSGTILLYNRVELKTSDHRPVVAVIEIPVTITLPEERDHMFEDLFYQIQPIYSPIYVYVEGEPCDQALCEEFMNSLNIGTSFSTKCLPNACLAIFEQSWMAEEALKYDGEFFQGKRLRVSVGNDNVVEVSNQTAPQAEDYESVETISSDVKAPPFRSPALPVSFSSGSLQALHHSTITRQNSTPQLHTPSSSVSTGSPKTSKKPPPRPPALANAPPRPPAISNRVKPPGAPPEGSPQAERPPPVLQPHFPPSNDLNGEVVSQQNTAPDYAFPDLSNWRVSAEPPKIKPRKTVPKRRAPVPPSASPLTQRVAPSLPIALDCPLIPSKTNSSLPPTSVGGSLLDNAFGSVTTPPAPLHAPLVPLLPSPANKVQTEDKALLSSFDPLAPSIKPPRPARAAPVAPARGKPPLPPPVSVDLFGDLLPSSNNAQDPWSSGGTGQQEGGTMNKSFTTDFNELFQ